MKLSTAFHSLLVLGFTTNPSLAQYTNTTANGCAAGFFPGTDTVIYTVPYTYAQVMSIIGSFKNISWSGSPADTVNLTGPDNTVGTSRLYDLDGAHVNETLIVYSKPPNGPYEEVHLVAPLTVPSLNNLSFYSDYDGTTVVPVCSNGSASTFNFTINFCATNATVAAGLLHTLHLTDAMTVGVFLGNMTFSSCSSMSGAGNGSATGKQPSATTSAPAMFTGGAVRGHALAGDSILTVFVTAGVMAAAAPALW